MDPTGNTELTERARLPTPLWEATEPLAYDLLGVVFEEEFSIGLEAANDAAVRPNVAPDGVYDEVVPLARSSLALEAVRQHTTEGAVTHLGHCTVTRVDEETVEFDVELRSEWTESGDCSGTRAPD